MEETYLIFRTGGQEVAVPIRQSRQVMPLERVSALPGTGGSVLGLMSAAGRSVPVVNLQGMTQLPMSVAALGLLCEHRQEQLILPIDEVSGTVSGDPPPQNMQILQTVSLNYRSMTLLNLDALLEALALRLQPV